MVDTFPARYEAINTRDPRFDGQFFTAVTSTGIYCRPSCPARTPKPENVVFFPTAAAAQAAGFRACKRCRPEATPGSPEWNARADLVARGLRLIADGVVDQEGVGGLARRLVVSERHLNRMMVAEVGAGPLALARMRRAQTARMLLDGTELPITDIAFTSGYSSVRQFNDSMREAFGCPPTELRRRGPIGAQDGSGNIVLRLTYRRPYGAAPLLAFLEGRAIPGVEEIEGNTYRRSLRLARGNGVLAVTVPAEEGHVNVHLKLDDLRDLPTAVVRCRRAFDLDADPEGVSETLGRDPLLGSLVRAEPGLRVPGHVDGFELAVRAVLGQQITVKGARTMASRLVNKLGSPIGNGAEGVTHMFPTAQAAAEDDLSGVGLTGSRINTLRTLSAAVASGQITLDPGADREETGRQLSALPGVGPWTVSYIAMRALGDPDAIPLTDIGIRNALQSLNAPHKPKEIAARSEAWRPWRSYATMHLWAHAAKGVPS